MPKCLSALTQANLLANRTHESGLTSPTIRVRPHTPPRCSFPSRDEGRLRLSVPLLYFKSNQAEQNCPNQNEAPGVGYWSASISAHHNTSQHYNAAAPKEIGYWRLLAGAFPVTAAQHCLAWSNSNNKITSRQAARQQKCLAC